MAKERDMIVTEKKREAIRISFGNLLRAKRQAVGVARRASL